MQPDPAPNTTPLDDRKPTGPFNRKVAYALGSVVLAGLVYFVSKDDPKPQPKAKAANVAAQQAQQRASRPPDPSQVNYASQLTSLVSPEALKADEARRRNQPLPPPDIGQQQASPSPVDPPGVGRSTVQAHSLDPAKSSQASPDAPAVTPHGTEVQAALLADAVKRDAQSLFAGLVVITNRKETPRQATGQATPPTPSQVSKPSTNTDKPKAGPTAPLNTIFEGTILEAVLTNRLNGTYTGPVNCMLTNDVWSHDRQRLLIPRGSRILGEAHRVSATGQQRLAVSFHRIIMPDGFSVDLNKFVGMNSIGETGLKDQVDNHYRQIFGVSIALGAIAGLSSSNTSYGYDSSGADAYRQGMSRSMSQEATQVLNRFLNILPTIIIREGHRVDVYLTSDMSVPDYDAHTLPINL